MLGRYFAEGLLPSSKRPRASANLVDKGRSYRPVTAFFVVNPAHEDFPRLGVVGFPIELEQPQVIGVRALLFGRCGQVCLEVCEELADCLEWSSGLSVFRLFRCMTKFFSFVEMWVTTLFCETDRIPESDSAAIGLGGGSAMTTLGSGASVHLGQHLETAVTLLQSSIQDNGAVITHDPLPAVQVDRGQTVRLFKTSSAIP